MSDDELIAGLEGCTLPESQFHHVDHVRAAWVYLTRYAVTEAIARFSQTLRSYTAFLGRPDRYHETVTWAYLLLLNERIGQSEPAVTWDAFAAAHGDLLDWKNPILRQYYREETLRSERARNVFVMPDGITTSPPGSTHPPAATASITPGDRPPISG